MNSIHETLAGSFVAKIGESFGGQILSVRNL
jgi:hypothetical protein